MHKFKYSFTNHLIEGRHNDASRSIDNTNNVKLQIKIGIQEDTEANWNLSKHTNIMHKR